MKITYCNEGVCFKTADLDTASAGEIADLILAVSRHCSGNDTLNDELREIGAQGELCVDGNPVPLRDGLYGIAGYVRNNRNDYADIFVWPRNWIEDTWYTKKLRNENAYLAAGDKYTVIDASLLDRERLGDVIDSAVFPVPEFSRSDAIELYIYSRSGSRLAVLNRPENREVALVMVPFRPGDNELDAAIIAPDSGTVPCFGYVHASGDSMDITQYQAKRPFRKLLCEFARFIAKEPDLSVCSDGKTYIVHDEKRKLVARLSLHLWKRILKTPPEKWSRDLITGWREQGSGWLPF